jgi:hypothetical protein
MVLALSETIEQIIRGNDIDITRTVNGIPSGQTITDGWFTVLQATNPFTQLYEKHITSTLIAGQGQIEDTGAGDGIGIVRFEITAANTLTMAGGTAEVPTPHKYGIQVKTSGGKIFECEQGVMDCVEQIVVSA